jgi:hypothetical protein
MRGMVLGYTDSNGEGMIAGDGGERFAFMRGDWKSPQTPASGMRVDFSVSDGKAIEIYAVPDTGQAPMGVPVKSAEAQNAFRLGAISLGCAIFGVIIPVIGLILALAAFICGFKGFNAGRRSNEQAGFIMAIIGMVISGLTLLGYTASIFFAVFLGTSFGLLMW